MEIAAPQPIRLKDYRPPAYLIDRVALDVSLNASETRVVAKLSMRPNPAAGRAAAPLELDGEQLALESIALDGRPLGPKDYKLTETHLTIAKPPRRPFVLETVTRISPESNTALQGLYRSRGAYCTQCEAEGFRRITYFLDRPDVLAVYTCRIEADVSEAPILLSNGNLVESGKLAGRRHYAIWHDPFPKPCYLFALVGGDLSPIRSSFTTRSKRRIDLAIYVEHGKEARAHWAMDCLKRAMRWDEVRFGREYDLDVFNIVAVSDFNMGAMENKGLNIFNDRLILASPDTATDAIFEYIEGVVAHEYFHNWTGNRITCRDWFQLCLKEGLTVFRDQEFTGDERSVAVQRIGDVRHLRTHQFPEDAGPLAHPVRPESYIEINNFYTPTVYDKGAELVRMIRTIVGDEAFGRGMDLYFERHDGHAATIEDFIACFEAASGANLAQFRLWYSQAGTPGLVCDFRYDKRSQSAELKVEQVLPPTPGEARKKPLHIPLRIGLIGANGAEVDLGADGDEDGTVLHVTKRVQTFRFEDVPSPPVPSLLRGFSAPVNLTLNLKTRDLEFLMSHDRDPFNRWQAANTYATRILVDVTKGLAAGRRPAAETAFPDALARAIDDESLDPAYRAELLKLPTEGDIAREIGRNVDPALIHRAHRQFRRLVATRLGDQLEQIYERSRAPGAYSPDAASTGLRSLRNASLTLLSARGGKRDIERLAQHYFRAGNMTDAAHALLLLAGTTGVDRERALEDFYQRWQRDHLVIDMWFAAQAQSPLAFTPRRVRALTRHPLFNRASPNKVRALIGTFAAQNPVQFNRPDGSGHRLVLEEVLAVDRLNPQIAARIAGAFRTWRTLEATRRASAKRGLQQALKSPDLSRDLFEIVSKMLEG